MIVKKIVSNLLRSNTFIIENDENAILIDCGCDLQKVKENIGDKKVVAIFLTHGHYDHSFYCKDYAREFNVPIYASEFIKETLMDPKANYSDGQFSLKDFNEFVFLKNDQDFHVGNFEVKSFWSPGHSKCCQVYLIEGLMFAGDVLFENCVGRVDLIGSSKKDMLKTLDKLENISFKKLYSGHGDESNCLTQQKNIKLFKRFLSR